MTAAADLLSRLSPAAAQRAVREYLHALITGEESPSAHPAVADLRSLPTDDRSLPAIIDALSRGTGPIPDMARSVLADTLNPALVTLGKSYPLPVHRSFVSIQQVPDFKRQSFIGGLDGLTLDPLNEHATLPVTDTNAISYELETGTVRQYGRVLRVARRHIVNDGSGFFRSAADALAAAAFRAEAGAVYGLLETGATLRDGAAWFDATNSVSSPSIMGAMEEGFELFADQRLSNGDFLDATPGVLLIPPTWSMQIGDTITDILLNVANGGLRIIKTGRVSTGYLIADPRQLPVIVLAGLSSDVRPTIEANNKPKLNLDTGLELRCLHDFGVVPVSRSGIVRMVVSPP
jgi:hypothetical protein